jgi:hypothetical protein
MVARMDVLLQVMFVKVRMCIGCAGGIVNKLSVDYVGLLVLGAFNTSIGRGNIRDDLQYSSRVLAPSDQLDHGQVQWTCGIREIGGRNGDERGINGVGNLVGRRSGLKG